MSLEPVRLSTGQTGQEVLTRDKAHRHRPPIEISGEFRLGSAPPAHDALALGLLKASPERQRGPLPETLEGTQKNHEQRRFVESST